MVRFRKGINFGVVSFFIAVTFFLNSTLYAIDLSVRIPFSFSKENSRENTKGFGVVYSNNQDKDQRNKILSISKDGLFSTLPQQPTFLEEIEEFLGIPIPGNSQSAKEAMNMVVRTTKPLIVFRGDIKGIAWLEGRMGPRLPPEERGILSNAALFSHQRGTVNDRIGHSKNVLKEYLEKVSFERVINDYSLGGLARGEKKDPFITTTTSFRSVLDFSGRYIYIIEIPTGELVVDAMSSGECVILIPHRIPSLWVKKIILLDSYARDLIEENLFVERPDSIEAQKKIFDDLGINLSFYFENIGERELYVRIQSIVNKVKKTSAGNPGFNLCSTLQGVPATFALLQRNPNSYKLYLNDKEVSIDDSTVLKVGDSIRVEIRRSTASLKNLSKRSHRQLLENL